MGSQPPPLPPPWLSPSSAYMEAVLPPPPGQQRAEHSIPAQLTGSDDADSPSPWSPCLATLLNTGMFFPYGSHPAGPLTGILKVFTDTWFSMESSEGRRAPDEE